MDLKEFAKLSDKDLKQLGKQLALKGYTGDLFLIRGLAKKELSVGVKLDQKRAEHNKAAKDHEIDKGRDLAIEAGKIEQEWRENHNQLVPLWQAIPNPPAKGVPEGGEENSRVIGRSWLQPRVIEKQKDHVALGEALNIIDIERGVKVAGSRFYYLKNEAVELEFALVRWIFKLLKKKGFGLMVGPQLLSKEVMNAAGYLGYARNEIYRVMDMGHNEFFGNTFQCPQGEDILVSNTSEFGQVVLPDGEVTLLVRCKNHNLWFQAPIAGLRHGLYLNGTAEQSILGYHMDEIIETPKRYAAFSTCFRREAGSYGKDVKGIIRTHQFDKIELFSFVEPKESEKEHKRLVALQEFILKKLEIPYQKVLIAAGDLGVPATKKIDLESWMPSQQRYRETHSCSNCTDWQARRATIRYRTEKGKTEYVHTLNGTAVAIGRILVALLENHQQPNGSVKIPKVLQSYCGFKEIKV